MKLSKEEIRLKCAEVAITHGTKIGMEKDACLAMAEKLYRFVMGETSESPEAKDNG